MHGTQWATWVNFHFHRNACEMPLAAFNRVRSGPSGASAARVVATTLRLLSSCRDSDRWPRCAQKGDLQGGESRRMNPQSPLAPFSQPHDYDLAHRPQRIVQDGMDGSEARFLALTLLVDPLVNNSIQCLHGFHLACPVSSDETIAQNSNQPRQRPRKDRRSLEDQCPARQSLERTTLHSGLSGMWAHEKGSANKDHHSCWFLLFAYCSPAVRLLFAYCLRPDRDDRLSRQRPACMQRPGTFELGRKLGSTSSPSPSPSSTSWNVSLVVLVCHTRARSGNT
ncbi:uncharacterized protein B0H64DRAFT_395913 [Chaetomium fimeti]|uniref:Uncharacterized protein n=1 Tax=Chaetomium fimeti TaxID=1854472 RepID=A0AAE0LRY8_9PEZI|nr:hypothetical protein B0H64DRAFT_395913 [Chaetomium fimeti]